MSGIQSMNTRLQIKAKAWSIPTPSFTPVRSSLLEHKVTRLVSQRPFIQPTLTINQPNDRYERKADRVVDDVVWMPEPRGTDKATVSDQVLQMKPMSVLYQCGDTRPECWQSKRRGASVPENLQERTHLPTAIDQRIGLSFLRFASGEVPDCGEKSYGEAGCDFENGIPTGKTWVNIEDTDPCTRPCTISHEGSHVKDLEPLCREHKACYDRAGDDVEARFKCDNEAADSLIAMHKFSECMAYATSLECLRRQLSKPECKSDKQQRIIRERIAEEQCYWLFYCFESLKAIARKIWEYLKRVLGSFIERTPWQPSHRGR